MRHRAITGYRNKLAAFHNGNKDVAKPATAESETKVLPPQGGMTLFGWVLSWGGPTLRLASVGAVIAFTGGHYFGHQSAMKKREWVEVSHPELPKSDRHWVLLSRSGPSLFTIELGTDGAIGSTVRTVSLETPGCTLRPFKITGTPHEQEEPAAKPPSVPAAPTPKPEPAVTAAPTGFYPGLPARPRR